MSMSATLRFTWETGTMRAVFSDSLFPSLPSVAGDVTDLSLLGAANVSRASVEALTAIDVNAQPAYLSSDRSLSDVDYMDGKRIQMSLATAKWMDLPSIEWQAFSVGEQVALDLQPDAAGDLAEQTLKAVFGVKSAATVLKRAASLRQYIVWFQKGRELQD